MSAIELSTLWAQGERFKGPIWMLDMTCRCLSCLMSLMPEKRWIRCPGCIQLFDDTIDRSFPLTTIMTKKAAYTTLLTRTSYLPGLLVLWHGLKRVDSQYPLVVMVTPDLPQVARDILLRYNIPMFEINTLLPAEDRHNVAEHDARFKDTWTKLRFETFLGWRSTSFIFFHRAFELVDFEVSLLW